MISVGRPPHLPLERDRVRAASFRIASGCDPRREGRGQFRVGQSGRRRFRRRGVDRALCEAHRTPAFTDFVVKRLRMIVHHEGHDGNALSRCGELRLSASRNVRSSSHEASSRTIWVRSTRVRPRAESRSSPPRMIAALSCRSPRQVSGPAMFERSRLVDSSANCRARVESAELELGVTCHLRANTPRGLEHEWPRMERSLGVRADHYLGERTWSAFVTSCWYPKDFRPSGVKSCDAVKRSSLGPRCATESASEFGDVPNRHGRFEQAIECDQRCDGFDSIEGSRSDRAEASP